MLLWQLFIFLSKSIPWVVYLVVWLFVDQNLSYTNKKINKNKNTQKGKCEKMKRNERIINCIDLSSL